MPGGMAAAAVGGQVTYETFTDELDELQQQCLVTGGAGSTGAGDRTVQAIYAEMNFPALIILRFKFQVVMTNIMTLVIHLTRKPQSVLSRFKVFF